MGYWKTRVLPTIKKVFENKTTVKKAASADACKSFDDIPVWLQESYDKEFEEKGEYQVKVLELYEPSPAEVKTLIKERKPAALKKYSAAVHKFLEELAKIGSKPVSEASEKYGAAYVPGPVFYVFEKVPTCIVTEEKVEEPTPAEPTPAKAEAETSSSKEKEIVIEEEKEEVVEVKKEEEEEEEEVVVVEKKSLKHLLRKSIC